MSSSTSIARIGWCRVDALDGDSFIGCSAAWLLLTHVAWSAPAWNGRPTKSCNWWRLALQLIATVDPTGFRLAMPQHIGIVACSAEAAAAHAGGGVRCRHTGLHETPLIINDANFIIAYAGSS